jgi:hypothetical protein
MAPEIYQLGRHVLLHGDCTEWRKTGVSDVDCIIFDPPWDSDIEHPDEWLPMSPNLIAFTDGQRFADPIRLFGAPTWVFTWDTMAPWSQGKNRPLKQCKHALWYGEIARYDRDGEMWGEPPEAKNHPTTQFTPDPRGRRLTDLYTQSLRWLHHPGATGAVGRHPHEKPIDWIRCLIGNCSTGDILDPFAGSGSTLIAAEMLGRRAFCVEEDRETCEAIVARYHDFISAAPKGQHDQPSLFGAA